MKTALMVIQFLVCFTLIGSVLLQPSRSAGLSGAIAGGAEQLFGKKKAKKSEVLASKVSTISAILFFILSIALVVIK